MRDCPINCELYTKKKCVPGVDFCESCGMHPPHSVGCREGHKMFIVDFTRPQLNSLSENGMFSYREGSIFADLTPSDVSQLELIFKAALLRQMEKLRLDLERMGRPR